MSEATKAELLLQNVKTSVLWKIIQIHIMKEKEDVIKKYEEYALKSVGDVAHYFCKLHNILQHAERNTLLHIKQNVIEFKAKMNINEIKIKKNIENLDDMVRTLKDFSKESERLHLKKVVDTTKKFLDYTTVSVTFPKIEKNPFKVEVNDELEKLLKTFCPYKIREENESSKDDNTPVYNPLITSIVSTGCKNNKRPTKSLATEFKSLSITKNQYEFPRPSTYTTNNYDSNKVPIHKVKITHFNNPIDFYVQYDSFASTENLIKKECAEEGAVSETPNKIEIGEIYLIKNTNKKYWKRGKILAETEPSTYQILLIDFGKIIITPKQFITTMSKELQSKEPCAKKCCIFGIDKKSNQKEWNEEILTLANDLILKRSCLLVLLKKTDEKFYVDLISTENYATSFRCALIFTDLVDTTLLNDRELIKNLKYYNLNKKKNLIQPLTKLFYATKVNDLTKFRVEPLNIISPSEFYVIQYDSQDEIKKFKMELNTFYNKNCIKIYGPRFNMKCAVKINGNWYRCRIIKVDNKLNVDVFLVDQGLSQTVHYTQLSLLDRSHCIINEYAFRCSLIDIEPLQANNFDWTQDALIEFQRIMKHSQLKIFIHSINSNFQHAVTLTITQKKQEINANALMVKYGHAVSTGNESVNVDILKTKSLFYESSKKSEENENDIILDKNKGITKIIKDYPIQSTSSTVKAASPVSVTSSTSSVSTPNIKQSKQNISLLKREDVLITHIVSPGEFYLHLKKYVDGIIKLHEYIQKQQQQNLNNKFESQIKHHWKSNDNCLAYIDLPHKTNKEWFRAKIIDIDNNMVNKHDIDDKIDEKNILKYTIYLRDHGITIKDLKDCDLSPIRTVDARISDGAIKCHLACVKPTGGTDIWSKGATDALKSYVERYQSISATIQGANVNNSIPTILWGLSSEISDALAPTIYKYVNINKTLNNLGFVELFEKFDRDKQIMNLTDVTSQTDLNNFDLVMKYIDETLNKAPGEELENCEIYGEDENFNNDDSDNSDNDENFNGWLSTTIDKTIFTAYPTYVDYDGYIYLHDGMKSNMLDKIKIFINKNISNDINVTETKTTKWSVDDPCTVRYHVDSLYYRGEIRKIINDNLYKVCFIDYGNEEDCTKDEIIKKIYLKKIPKQAVKYELYGVEANTSDGKWPQSTLDLMHISIVTKLCSVAVIKTDDNTSIKKCSVKVGTFDLAEFLIDKNLAKDKRVALSIAEKYVESFSITLTDTSNSNEENTSVSPLIKHLEDNDDNSFENKGKFTDDEDDENIKFESNNNNQQSFSSSDDENKIYHEKQNDKVDHIDVDAYINIFQTEELNKFYTSVLSESQSSSDEIDAQYDYLYQPWNKSKATNQYLSSKNKIEKDKKFSEDLNDDINNDNASIELFNPMDTSTVIPHFDGLEHFQFYKLPHGFKEFYCEIEYMENLTNFYISPAITDLHKQYFEMMKNIQTYIKSSRSHLIEMEIKKPCLALYDEDNLYYRGIIKQINIESQKAEILYVDFLNSNLVSFENIKKCPNKFLNYPLRLMPVQLFGVKINRRRRESDIKTNIKTIINSKKIFAEIIVPGKIPEVQFYLSQTNRDLVLQELYDKKSFLPK